MGDSARPLGEFPGPGDRALTATGLLTLVVNESNRDPELLLLKLLTGNLLLKLLADDDILLSVLLLLDL